MLKKISLKWGLIFSSTFLLLFILFSFLLYEVVAKLFADYIIQDLLARGDNHAKVLTTNFNQTTLMHVALMEQNVATKVVVIDHNQKILISSQAVDAEMESFLNNFEKNIDDLTMSSIINANWHDYNYIVTVSPIKYGSLGYVVMFYQKSVLKEIVAILQLLIFMTSIGIFLVGIGIIIIISKKITAPLLQMQEATGKMAKGEYCQIIKIKGNDELAQLANAIQVLGKELHYYEESRNEFLASISHELRTPLTYLKGYSDVLLKDLTKDQNEQKGYLKIINEEAKRLTFIVDDLFKISKENLNNLTLKKELIDIISLIEKVRETLTPLAYEKGISIKIEDKTVMPLLYLDPKWIQQVFYNLLENAIKYTKQGEIRITAEITKDNVIFQVIDQGIGIPPRDLGRIWERFYRVEKSRARTTGGVGLGLYIVKQIIELHGGEIMAKSVEGKGTTMIIKFKRNEVVK